MGMFDLLAIALIGSAMSGNNNRKADKGGVKNRKSRREARVRDLRLRRAISAPETPMTNIPVAIMLCTGYLLATFCVFYFSSSISLRSEINTGDNGHNPLVEIFSGLKTAYYWIAVAGAGGVGLSYLLRGLRFIYKKFYLDALVSISGSILFLALSYCAAH